MSSQTKTKMPVAELYELRISQLRECIQDSSLALEAARNSRMADDVRAYWVTFFSQRLEYSTRTLQWYIYMSGKPVTAEDNVYAHN